MRSRLLVIVVCALILAVSVFAPAVFNTLFDAVDLALGWAGPFFVVFLVSALTGLLFIMAFPHISAQGWIVAVKDKIKYNLLGIRIYQDNLPSVMKSTGGTLGWNFVYLGLNILPMIVLAGPFMAVWFQLNAHYAFKPLEVGDTRLVSVELNEGVDPTEVEIFASTDGDRIENWKMVGAPVRLMTSEPDKRPRLLFEVEATSEGSGAIGFRHHGEVIEKGFEVGTDPARLAKVRTANPGSEFLATRDPLVWFGEPILEGDAFVQTVFVDYEAAPLGPTSGGELWIMGVFLIVSLAVGFGLKGAFGVEI